MTDVLTVDQRRLNMSRIRGKDTNIELRVRRLLHAEGLRFRLHQRQLPGTPDIVLAKHRACIFIHGCFWHGHSCPLFKVPRTRTDFWMQKIDGNRMRDDAALTALLELGWRVLTIWECALRGTGRIPEEAFVGKCGAFMHNGKPSEILAGVFA